VQRLVEPADRLGDPHLLQPVDVPAVDVGRIDVRERMADGVVPAVVASVVVSVASVVVAVSVVPVAVSVVPAVVSRVVVVIARVVVVIARVVVVVSWVVVVTVVGGLNGQR